MFALALTLTLTLSQTFTLTLTLTLTQTLTFTLTRTLTLTLRQVFALAVFTEEDGSDALMNLWASLRSPEQSNAPSSDAPSSEENDSQFLQSLPGLTDLRSLLDAHADVVEKNISLQRSRQTVQLLCLIHEALDRKDWDTLNKLFQIFRIAQVQDGYSINLESRCMAALSPDCLSSHVTDESHLSQTAPLRWAFKAQIAVLHDLYYRTESPPFRYVEAVVAETFMVEDDGNNRYEESNVGVSDKVNSAVDGGNTGSIDTVNSDSNPAIRALDKASVEFLGTPLRLVFIICFKIYSNKRVISL